MPEQYAIHSVGRGRLVVVVQSDLISTNRSVVVIPLETTSELDQSVKGLNPIVSLGDDVFVLLTQSMAAIHLSLLGPKVGSLEHLSDEITRALDLLFHGV